MKNSKYSTLSIPQNRNKKQKKFDNNLVNKAGKKLLPAEPTPPVAPIIRNNLI